LVSQLPTVALLRTNKNNQVHKDPSPITKKVFINRLYEEQQHEFTVHQHRLLAGLGCPLLVVSALFGVHFHSDETLVVFLPQNNTSLAVLKMILRVRRKYHH
jgi:hypothetical protein